MTDTSLCRLIKLVSREPEGEGDRGIIVMSIIKPRLELYPERSERVESAEVVSARWDRDVYIVLKWAPRIEISRLSTLDVDQLFEQ